MPWVNVTTSRELSGKKREMIAEVVSNTLFEVIDKNPDGVFVSVNRAQSFFWGGVKRNDAAIFDIRWIGTFSSEQRKEITRRLITEIGPAAKLNPSHMRVIFTSKDRDDWGRHGT